jgi:hypothetical protein
MMTATVANALTTVTIDLIGEITMIAGPIPAMRTGIDVIIATTTAAMIGATTTIAMTVMTDVTITGVITVTTSAMIDATTDEMINVKIDVARTTTISTTIIGRNGLPRHRPKGATPMVRSRRPAVRSTSSSVVPSDQKQ